MGARRVLAFFSGRSLHLVGAAGVPWHVSDTLLAHSRHLPRTCRLIGELLLIFCPVYYPDQDRVLLEQCDKPSLFQAGAA